MNETIQNFLEMLNVDYEKFNSLKSKKIENDADVNPVISRFAFFKGERENKTVSIEDVVGYNYNYLGLGNANIIQNLSGFFDKNGDGYHSRSVSMLEIPVNSLMQELDYSFTREPICLSEADEGKYIIGSNGLHRFHVIRMHYLNELSKLDPQDTTSRQSLREKYSFKANVSSIDYIKTYSAFLLNCLDSDIRIETYYTQDWEITDKVSLYTDSNPEKKVVLSNDQLVNVVNNQINKFLKSASKQEIKHFNELVKDAYQNYDTFKQFYDNNINHIIKQEKPNGNIANRSL